MVVFLSIKYPTHINCTIRKKAMQKIFIVLTAIIFTANAFAQVSQETQKIGDNYEGGKIFYIFQPGDKSFIEAETHGLVVATADQGKDNWNNANQLCTNFRNGKYRDWYLPSKEELSLLYKQKSVIGGLTDNTYWSSTEMENGNVWGINFKNGMQYGSNKNIPNYIRAIRAF
jgi:hypothetical protein